MKTKEFIKSVEALGFQTHVSGKKIKVCDGMRGYDFDDPMFIITPDFPEVYIPSEFYMLSIERFNVLKLIIEYLDTPNSEREEEKFANTPPEERSNEKIYNVILPLDGAIRRTRYLQRIIGLGITDFRFDNSSHGFVKSNPELYAFTEQEIKDIDERYLAFKVEVTPE